MVIAISLVFTVSACTSAMPESTVTPETTVTPIPKNTPIPTNTTTPKPTPTATPVPLSQVELEPLLIKTGDLPAGLSGAQIRSSLPGMFRRIPEPDNGIYRGFERDGDESGGVTVVLYESRADVDSAYATIMDGFGDLPSRQEVEGVGEKAETVSVALALAGAKDFVDLAFVRCHSVVHIRMMGTIDLLDIKSYAERLDERLTGVACR
jgi:hypothetical protein